MRGNGVLVAGLGNIFHGDDGFGVEVVRQLGQRRLPPEVSVRDIGIRSLDLTFALQDGWELAVLVDATRRGRPPGTLYLLDLDGVELATAPAPIDPHSLHPDAVLAIVQATRSHVTRLRLVGCEPMQGTDPDEELTLGLSQPVQAAIPEAVNMIEQLVLRHREPGHA